MGKILIFNTIWSGGGGGGHTITYRVFFFSLVPPLKVLSTNKLILARLGVSRPSYVNVDSPHLGFPYFNFLGGVPVRKKNTLYI